MPDLSRVDVIAPNFKRRLSGVTATVARLVPLQAQTIAITTCAPDMPPEVPNIHWSKLLTMSRSGPSGARVWHARRNVEMIAGLALKTILRKRLKLLFTSASQRNHTGLTRFLIARMDAVIATSGKTATYLERPATTIMHGIDLTQFSPHSDRKMLRKELNLPTDGILLGCFGRIRAQKGTDAFVDMMIGLASQDPTVCGIVMGRATEKYTDFLQSLKDRVADADLQDRILFLPEVPVWEIAKYYQSLDLYVAPQRWEGFGLTPLEAMACGAPVLATRVGAFDEIVTPLTGALVDPDDIPALQNAAMELIERPTLRTEMRDAARAHVVEHFDIQGEARAITDQYRALLTA